MNGRPDIGACSGIPDIGAWQFVIPDGLRSGTLGSSPAVSGALETTAALTGQLAGQIVIDGELGADQS